MKKISNTNYTKMLPIAWALMLVSYVAAVSMAGLAANPFFCGCAAMGAIGFAQSLAELLEEGKPA